LNFFLVGINQPESGRQSRQPKPGKLKENSARAPSKKIGKKTQEEEIYWKFSKKIQRKRHPTFKPPESSAFQIAARSGLWIREKKPVTSVSSVPPWS